MSTPPLKQPVLKPVAQGGGSSASETATLDPLRRQIDAIDEQVVKLLTDRRQVVEKIADLKHELNLPMFHPAREEDLISTRRAQAAAAGLDPDYVEDLFRTVLRHSRVGQPR